MSLTASTVRPQIALTIGDPAGIGPEIVLAALADARVRDRMRLVAIGPRSLRPDSVEAVDRAVLAAARDHVWLVSPGPDRWEMGRVQATCGRAALEALRLGHELALAREVDALVTGPVNKEALHLAGEKVEGQTELLGRWSGAERCEMLAVAGRLRVLLLTRHMPLRRALDAVTTERVLAHLVLLDDSLRRFGFGRPRLALAGMNPHAGEGGILGREDADLLLPAVLRARGQGIDVTGPVSPDAVFLRASQGEFDGVLALYHDQAFIPIKLLSQEGGVTVIVGLPYLRVSPVHGTAFDIAGQGRASPANLIAALEQAADWAAHATQRP